MYLLYLHKRHKSTVLFYLWALHSFRKKGEQSVNLEAINPRDAKAALLVEP
jgi:hypothetical protein